MHTNREPASEHAAERRRIAKLSRSWDAEHALTGDAAGVALIALILGATKDKRWYFLAGLGTGALLLHSLFDWYPPGYLALLRKFGFRRRPEIDEEIAELKLHLEQNG